MTTGISESPSEQNPADHPKHAIGASPGTLLVDPGAPPPVFRAILYGPDRIEERSLESPREARALLDQNWPMVWIQVEGLGSAEAIRQLGELFSLHRLALEDVVNVHQRPKVEDFGDILFLTARSASLKKECLETHQVSLFLGPRWLLSFEENPGSGLLNPIRERLRKSAGRIRASGPDYLGYAILDTILDHYFPILEEFNERLENLEDDVLIRPAPSALSNIHHIKRELLTLRRILWPFREVFNMLCRDPYPQIAAETRTYLRDGYDHALRILDMNENARELCADLLNLHLSAASNRMNEVMKVLTIIATVFIPLSFITGLYGMNFDSDSPWNLPELHFRYGYPAVLLVMLIASMSLLYYFRRKGWIGAQSAESADTRRDHPRKKNRN